ncbi:phasin family protein [Xanthobacter sp. TB0136]|uniref:phasin family protein n=1 Tax=Xanthobacter sp. TB0136 TaxID=3459177 RepID=UPI00403A0F04
MSDTFIKAYQDQIEAAKKALASSGVAPVEVPASVREMAEKNLAAYRENYEKLKASTSQLNSALESTYENAGKGVSEYNARVLEALQSNIKSTFDFYNSLINAKTMAEVVELSTGHARQQFETVSSQVKDLSALAQKVASESADSLKATVEKTVRSGE